MSQIYASSQSAECGESDVNPVTASKVSETTENDLSTLFRSTLCKTVEKCLGSMKLSTFKEYYKEIDERYPINLQELHSQLIAQLYSIVHKEIEDFCEEENIIKYLDSLDDIIQSEKSCGQEAWRPSGNPEEDLHDYVYDVKLQNRTALENILNKLNKENEELSVCVQAMHSEILNKQAQNEDVIKKIEKETATVRSQEMRLLKCKLHQHIPSKSYEQLKES